MQLDELSKRFIQIIAPNGVLTTLLIGLRTFNIELALTNVIIFNLLFALAYVALWHEVRLKTVESQLIKGSKEE